MEMRGPICPASSCRTVGFGPVSTPTERSRKACGMQPLVIPSARSTPPSERAVIQKRMEQPDRVLPPDARHEQIRKLRERLELVPWSRGVTDWNRAPWWDRDAGPSTEPSR